MNTVKINIDGLTLNVPKGSIIDVPNGFQGEFQVYSSTDNIFTINIPTVGYTSNLINTNNSQDTLSVQLKNQLQKIGDTGFVYTSSSKKTVGASLNYLAKKLGLECSCHTRTTGDPKKFKVSFDPKNELGLPPKSQPFNFNVTN
jgi:hypothetical protein